MIVQNQLHHEDMGLLYGFSLFETFLINKTGNIFLLHEHLKRLYQSAAYFRIETGYALDTFMLRLKDEIEKEKTSNTIMRVTLSAGNTQKGIAPFISFSSRNNPYTYEKISNGAKIQVSPVCKSKNSKLVSHKTGNYLENFLLLQDIMQNGYEDAVFLNEDRHLTETAKCNVFFVKKGTLYTPDISCGLLNGIIREWVIDYAKHLGVPCCLGEYSLDVLMQADEVFETNSAMGLMHIASINDQVVFDGKIGPITSVIAKELYTQMEIFQ